VGQGPISGRVQPKWRRVLSVILLTLLAFLNLADRFSLAGVLIRLQTFYDINDSMAGLLQTVYILAYVGFSVLVALLGDRLNRKWLILFANAVWVALMIASSFVPENAFGAFMALRALLSCGNAFTNGLVIALIGDWFQDRSRGYAMMVYYWSLPVGSSIGIIVSSVLVEAGVHWQWILRICPVLGAGVLVLILVFVQEPLRGGMESDPASLEAAPTSIRGIWEDIKAIFRVKSYLSIVIAIAANNFVLVSAAWWTPLLVLQALSFQSEESGATTFHGQSYSLIQTLIGVVIAVGGIAGGSLAVWIAQNWKEGRLCFTQFQTVRAFPLVGAIGSLLAFPSAMLLQPSLSWDIYLVYFLNFYNSVLPSGNPVMAMDVLMEVIPSSRRASATSILYVFAYLLGDCPGPYIAGAISDAIRAGSEDPESRFHALVSALYATSSLFSICIAAFLAAAYFMKNGRLVTSSEDKEPVVEDDLEMTKISQE
ncbi:hypothetical protein PENTCL1PPCAC_3430, partial [Pristionchus entomophagus]